MASLSNWFLSPLQQSKDAGIRTLVMLDEQGGKAAEAA